MNVRFYADYKLYWLEITKTILNSWQDMDAYTPPRLMFIVGMYVFLL